MRVISDPFALDPYIAELEFPGSSVPQTYAPSAVFSLSLARLPCLFSLSRAGRLMFLFFILIRTSHVSDGSMQAPINSHTSLR